MSLFSTLNTGVTGLGVHSTALSVTGDNLANLSTIGFKGSRAEFQDLLIRDIPGASRTSQLGMGAFLGGVATQFTQGAISTSGRSSDLAIDGSGLFVVSSDEGQFYTRAGSFSVDSDGRIATLGGYALQGYNVDAAGNLGASLGDLVIPTDALPPSATANITVQANLDSDADLVTATSDWSVNGFPATDPAQAASDAAYSTSVTVHDSLGAAHDVVLYFQKTAANTWTYWAAVDAEEVGGNPGELYLVENGQLDFDTDGALLSISGVTTNALQFTGADPQTLAFDFGDPSVGSALGQLTQYAGPSTVTGLEQDGFGSGDLIDWRLDPDGSVRGIYSNGEERLLGQVALALFTSTDGLVRAGDNLWMANERSGEPLIGAAESGGRGSVYQYALEGSNVDIEREFVSMITAQRGYQASARVISSSDDLLQELVNIV